MMEFRRVKSKLSPSKPGNSAAIQLKTRHPNVIIPYREGLPPSKSRPVLIRCLTWKHPNLRQKPVRLGSGGHSSRSEGWKQKKSEGWEQNLSKKPWLFSPVTAAASVLGFTPLKIWPKELFRPSHGTTPRGGVGTQRCPNEQKKNVIGTRAA